MCKNCSLLVFFTVKNKVFLCLFVCFFLHRIARIFNCSENRLEFAIELDKPMSKLIYWFNDYHNKTILKCEFHSFSPSLWGKASGLPKIDMQMNSKQFARPAKCKILHILFKQRFDYYETSQDLIKWLTTIFRCITKISLCLKASKFHWMPFCGFSVHCYPLIACTVQECTMYMCSINPRLSHCTWTHLKTIDFRFLFKCSIKTKRVLVWAFHDRSCAKHSQWIADEKMLKIWYCEDFSFSLFILNKIHLWNSPLL